MIATGMLLVAFLLTDARRTPPGLRGAIALGGIALIAMALSLTRGDPMPLIGPARLDTVAAAAILLLAGAFAAARMLSSPEVVH
jgi:peptidoglycan/LPS O-acetylase OafA/YrhL